jgi:hypothetical protein
MGTVGGVVRKKRPVHRRSKDFSYSSTTSRSPISVFSSLFHFFSRLRKRAQCGSVVPVRDGPAAQILVDRLEQPDGN